MQDLTDLTNPPSSETFLHSMINRVSCSEYQSSSEWLPSLFFVSALLKPSALDPLLSVGIHYYYHHQFHANMRNPNKVSRDFPWTINIYCMEVKFSEL
jgi:hypothetical protein